jgi:hypothetical protein
MLTTQYEQPTSQKAGGSEEFVPRSSIHRSFEGLQAIELSYLTDVLNMVVVRGYVAKLLTNAAVVRFLQANYPDFLNEFRAIVAAGSLEEGVKP